MNEQGRPSLGDSISAAAKRAGFGPVADPREHYGLALFATMGGVRGLTEALLPGLLFLLAYTFTSSLPISLIAAVGIALIFSIARLIRRSPLTQALAGLIGVGASAVLALFTNRGEDFFVPGLYVNAGYGLGLLVSVLVGWPLIGVAVGYLMGEGTAWRLDRRKFIAMQILTLCWVTMFALRLAVQLPLYFAGNVEWLAATKLLMGIPLYAPLLLLSWLIARSAFGAREQPPTKSPGQGSASRDATAELDRSEPADGNGRT